MLVRMGEGGTATGQQGSDVEIVDPVPQEKQGWMAGQWQTPCPGSSIEWLSRMEIASDQPIQVQERSYLPEGSSTRIERLFL
jgi:hypothetical protein